MTRTSLEKPSTERRIGAKFKGFTTARAYMACTKPIAYCSRVTPASLRAPPNPGLWQALRVFAAGASLLLIPALINHAQSEQQASATNTPQSVAPYPRLKATGITWGGNYPEHNNPDCQGWIELSSLTKVTTQAHSATGVDIIAQQDCAQSADAQGKPAFRYQKLNATGAPISDEQTGACVLDQITGLVWELKEPGDGVYGNQGLHDADDRFRWYYGKPNANGGAIGDWNGDTHQCTGYAAKQPATFCNISEFVSRVNRSGLCGANDWRVPTRTELESLVNYGRTQPAIHLHYFPQTQNDFYWTLSPTAEQTLSAWAVSFEFGFSAPMPRSQALPVRLVRSASAAAEVEP